MDSIPVGYCQCGCGRKTWIATQTHKHLGWKRGQPVRFLSGHHRAKNYYETLEERFWQRVDKRRPDECWPFRLTPHADGYGSFKYHGKEYGAHRVSYEIANDCAIPDGMVVMHTCDNPPCVNPAHLELGTNLDNIADRDKKGRCARGNRTGARLHPEVLKRGESHYESRFTESDIVTIRQSAADGMAVADLARRHGVTHRAIVKIVRRLSWKHVP